MTEQYSNSCERNSGRKRMTALGVCCLGAACAAVCVIKTSTPATSAAATASADVSTVVKTSGNSIATSLPPFAKNYLRPATIPFPDENRYTQEREQLGKMLFFDPRLSGSNILSCASCHNPAFSWGDSLPKGVGNGMNTLGRRTPTILNLAWAELLFWDGRADSLEHQALGPIASTGEMNMPLDTLITKLNNVQGYKPLFEAAYPGEGICKETVGKAIATFERGVVSADNAPFDDYINGQEYAISDSAKRGFVLFNTKANCASCHSGWSFTDHSFHDIGVADDDIGRAKNLNLPSMQHAFKTPTLRNAATRQPYMHNGTEQTLEEVVEFYNVGGRAQRPSLAPEMKPLNLTTQEKSDLVEFMKTLSSNDSPVTVPVLPR